MRGRPFGDRRSGRNAAERGIATVFKEKRMPRRHPFVLAGSVSRVLYSAARFRCGAPVIYLRRRSPAASSNLPPDIGRATLNCRYTRSCNPSDVRPATSLPPRWALTPPFHPYPCGAVIFCYTCYTLTDIKPLACVALCVARTFLSPARGSDKASLPDKSTQKMKITARLRPVFCVCILYLSRKSKTFRLWTFSR